MARAKARLTSTLAFDGDLRLIGVLGNVKSRGRTIVGLSYAMWWIGVGHLVLGCVNTVLAMCVSFAYAARFNPRQIPNIAPLSRFHDMDYGIRKVGMVSSGE